MGVEGVATDLECVLIQNDSICIWKAESNTPSWQLRAETLSASSLITDEYFSDKETLYQMKKLLI